MAACAAGREDAARLLLGRNADVNRKSRLGDSPLLCAVSGGSLSVCHLLIAHGADPNAEATHPSARGFKPLMLAAFKGRADLVELLLAAGADPLQRSSLTGWSARDVALRAGHRRIASLLEKEERHALKERARYWWPYFQATIASASPATRALCVALIAMALSWIMRQWRQMSAT